LLIYDGSRIDSLRVGQEEGLQADIRESVSDWRHQEDTKEEAFAEALGVITDVLHKESVKSLSQATGSVTDATKKKAIKVPELASAAIIHLQAKKAIKPLSQATGSIAHSMQKTHRFLRTVADIIKTVISGVYLSIYLAGLGRSMSIGRNCSYATRTCYRTCRTG
jgi:hypothetical protein